MILHEQDRTNKRGQWSEKVSDLDGAREHVASIRENITKTVMAPRLQENYCSRSLRGAKEEGLFSTVCTGMIRDHQGLVVVDG